MVAMVKVDREPAEVPLSAEQEAFLRAWGRAVLTVPRALEADLLIGQGMPLSEYTALMHLSEAPGRSLRMSDLANVCALSLSGMSRIVSRLEAQGLVERERCSRDGRGLNAVLTDAGLSRLQRAWPTHLASVRRHMMDHLNDLDLPAVTTALQHFASDTPYADPEQRRGEPQDQPSPDESR
jgi:DNA-binding MarR family transcriptional regulator